MKHLHYKLSAAMFIIMLLLGGAFYAIDRYSVKLYYEELSQRLNASLAMYVVDAGTLVNDGEVGVYKRGICQNLHFDHRWYIFPSLKVKNEKGY